MRVVRTISELRLGVAKARQAAGDEPFSVGMVPTMGALHEGHLSLLRAAKAANRFVVLTVFVNPTQFNESQDLAAYPRQEAADIELAESVGTDLFFAPSAGEIYPAEFATTVRVSGPLTETLEGASRSASHFDGVATVVSKMLLTVLPERAYFGQKDAQQLLVIRRMVKDLGIPVEIVACPTVREADGLAMSSRNARLEPTDRERAAAIPRALRAIEAAVALGEHRVDQLREIGRAELATGAIHPEYLAFVEPESLTPVRTIRGESLCALAARVGDVRLIDNVVLRPATVPAPISTAST